MFGCKVFVHVPKEKRKKLNSKSKNGIFIGYDDNQLGYRIWIPGDNKIEVSRDVLFRESQSVVEQQNSADSGERYAIFGPELFAKNDDLVEIQREEPIEERDEPIQNDCSFEDEEFHEIQSSSEEDSFDEDMSTMRASLLIELRNSCY